MLADPPAAPAAPAAPAQPAQGVTDPAAPAAPEVWKLEAPEWAKAEVQRFEEFGKANKLTREQTQAILKAEVDAGVARFNREVDAEIAAIQADPQLGGANFQKTQDAARRALRAFATVEERAAIAANPRYGNDRFLVKILARAGAAIKEDAPVNGQPEVPPQQPQGQRQYSPDGKPSSW